MDLKAGQAILGQKVDVVFIGSCTNSRISDLRLAASVLKGRRVAEGVRVMVVPGSQQVKTQAESEGLDEVFKAAGAEWREAGCSMCIAMNGDQLTPGPVRDQHLEPQLRGSPGQGRPDLPGLAPDRRRVGPDRRDHRPAPPVGHRRRRPAWAAGKPMAGVFTTFTSRVIPLPAENVDTDQIVPARYLKMTDKAGLPEALFHDWRYDAGRRPARAPVRASTEPAMQRPPDPARRRQLRRPARRASTPHGRSRPGASGRSCRPASPTSSGAMP